MFKNILNKFDDLSIADKRKEINNEILFLYYLYEKMCKLNNIEYRDVIDDEVKELISNPETEDEYLDSIFAYVEALKEMQYDWKVLGSNIKIISRDWWSKKDVN